MKLPRNVNGSTLVTHLERHWRYTFVRQTGSHVRIRTDHPSEQFITVPLHRPLKAGTLAAIVKQVAAHKRVEIEEVLSTL